MTFQPELQAVVLAAGRGSRISEITAGKPKCLLPLGPKPLIWYILEKLQNSGFTEVILVVLETQKSEIQNVLDNMNLNVNIEYESVSEENEDLGTADSLRRISDRLKSDVLVLSCDLVSNVDLKGVIDTFRMHNAAVASLFVHPQQSEPVVTPGPKSKYKPERDLIGIDSQTNRLVFLASASDFEEEVSLPTSLFRKHPHIKMYSKLIDAHIYLLKNWVVKFLAVEEGFASIKGELIPYIVKKQLSKPPKSVETNQSIVNTSSKDNDIFAFAREDELDLMIREASAYNDHTGDLKPSYMGDSIRCYAHIASKDTFGVRVNTLPAYWSTSAKIIQYWDKITKSELIRKNSKATITSNQIDDKCIIWEGAKLNEKTSFKNSIIGQNSEIHSFSRVFNSIVMNNVTVKEKVAIENCIICDGAIIEKGCQLKGCVVGSCHVVPETSEHSNEVLTESDRLMEF